MKLDQNAKVPQGQTILTCGSQLKRSQSLKPVKRFPHADTSADAAATLEKWRKKLAENSLATNFTFTPRPTFDSRGITKTQEGKCGYRSVGPLKKQIQTALDFAAHQPFQNYPCS